MIDKDLLRSYTAPFGVYPDDTACEKLDRYAQLLVQWNEKMNLTGITDPDGIALKHFADSLTALPLLPEQSGATLVDVGTGAGFPAVPLSIVRPDLRVTLLDSLNKRLIFLQEVCRELELNAVTVHARAEEGGHRPDLREQFDVATARAVAALPTLSEYCLPFVKVGGRFIAMKGPESDGEAAQAAKGIALLGGTAPVVTEHKLVAADGEVLTRRLFVIRKTGHTPPAYPRHGSKIAKQPL